MAGPSPQWRTPIASGLPFSIRGRAAKVKLLEAPGNQTRSITSLAIAPDGKRLVWGESRGGVALWDLWGGRLLFRDNVDDESLVSDVEFSPDGSMIASVEGDAIRLRRVARPQDVVRELRMPSASAPGQPNTPESAAPATAGDEAFRCLAFTPDGTRLVGGTYHDATLVVWRIADGKVLRKISCAHGPLESGRALNKSLQVVAVTPDSRRIMSIGKNSDVSAKTRAKHELMYVTTSEVRFWDIETGQRIADYHNQEDLGPGYGALSRDGRHVAVGDWSRLRIFDATTGQSERQIDLPGWHGGPPEFSPDGAIVAVPVDNAIGLFEVSTGRRLHHGPSSPIGLAISVAWSPAEGDWIATGHTDGFVRLWNAANGELIWHKLFAPLTRRSGRNARARSIGFSRDGKHVIAAGWRDDPVAGQNGVVAVYEAASGKTVHELSQREVPWAVAAADRILVVASQSVRGDTGFQGIEMATCRTRWTNPTGGEEAGFMQPAAMQLEAKPPWLEAALTNGDVIRLNALTGHEQRRFRADPRTPKQKEAEEPP